MSFIRFDPGGRNVRLAVARTVSGVWVGWPGGAKFFPREPLEAAAAAAGPEEVRAPMTGRVVKVAVATGGAVVADDLLVILQAMKMEYRLTAPRAGVVALVGCAEGDMVELGALLVTLEVTREPDTVVKPRRPEVPARTPRHAQPRKGASRPRGRR